VSPTQGQAAALEQLRAIERLDPTAVDILSTREPAEDGGVLRVEVSLDCRGIEHHPVGVRMRERERFVVSIGEGFPFTPPSVFVVHRRWAGTPHVQWGRSLCIYVAPAVEWQPSDGMFGFVERLWLWLKKAAAGELDPDDAPLHPPVAYLTSGVDVPMIIPRADTPAVGAAPWIGGVVLEKVSGARIDLVGWKENLTSWLEDAAPAILLPGTLDFEYPSSVRELIGVLDERGVRRDVTRTMLEVAALGLEEDAPLIVVIGSAMRGTAADRRQHLSTWCIEPLVAWGLRTALDADADDQERRERGKRVREIIDGWAEEAKVHWCPVREARPEVTVRRDKDSPLRWFEGKSVALWGCGALGAPIAELLVRAGVTKLTVYDNASVSPGVLVRQPFTDADVGRNKATVLAERLQSIRPRNFEVVARPRNVLYSALETENWHDGAVVVVDATASLAVTEKLERARRLNPQVTQIVSIIVGHTAQHALAAIAPDGYSGATADVFRQIKLACGRGPGLRAFLREFWPAEPRTEIFQPEPGCSDPTFTGSGAEVAALASQMLVRIARDLAGDDRGYAIGHALALGPSHDGPREARMTFPPTLRVPDAAENSEIRLARTARVAMEGWIASSARELGPRTETGGLLFGERDSAAGVIWADEIIGPPPDSRRSPQEFVCGTQGVDACIEEKQVRGRGSLEYLGMWHTHPTQDPVFSARDLCGMQTMLDAASSPLSHGLLLIVGHTLPGPPELGAFVFERSELENPDHDRVWVAPRATLDAGRGPPGKIGLSLSGGGSRAIAFHLGCLRALNDRGILQRISLISSVSGGSLISALWAYSDEDFDAFDARTCELLRRGLQRDLAQRALLSRRTPEQVATRVVAGGAASAARAAWAVRRSRGARGASTPPLSRWVSRTDAFIDVLQRDVCGERQVSAQRRPGLDVVINACELRTGSAFRFGTRESGCWRVGRLPGNDVALATAVAASAAYPLLLPAIDRKWTFERRDGTNVEERVILTDGGVFENLGTSCLEPGRSAEYSYNVFPVDYIIACDAGRGLLDPVITYGWTPRVHRAFDTTFRKLQDGARGRLHDLTVSGRLQGFVMPYLGQQDRALPVQPSNLVCREAVASYPTDFRAMSPEMLATLSTRGEQLTLALLDAYLPYL
jgi:integrative and conjugative element protein (TIGR02256 family)